MATCRVRPARIHAAVPGMLSAADFARAETVAGAAFDRLFIRLVTAHHRPCARPAIRALRVMAHAIRHGQGGEIALMHGIPRDFAVSQAAWQSLFAPAGEGDTGGGH